MAKYGQALHRACHGLRLAPGGRPHIGLGPTAPIVDYERVAPNYPVFRIVYQDTLAPFAGK